MSANGIAPFSVVTQGQVADPGMEDILSAIRKILHNDDAAAGGPRSGRGVDPYPRELVEVLSAPRPDAADAAPPADIPTPETQALPATEPAVEAQSSPWLSHRR